METANKVAKWLASLANERGYDQGPILPVTVKLGRSGSFEGAVYFRNGESDSPWIYLVGTVPNATKSSRTAYSFPNDDRAYVLGSYTDATAVSEHPEFHPFGEAFQLFRCYYPEGPRGGKSRTVRASIKYHDQHIEDMP